MWGNKNFPTYGWRNRRVGEARRLMITALTRQDEDLLKSASRVLLDLVKEALRNTPSAPTECNYEEAEEITTAMVEEIRRKG
jgi:hypothetical protein